MSAATAERFSYPTTSMLNSNFSPVSRLAGQTIIPDNFGAYNGFTEIVIGGTNVGTVLTFSQRIRNYLYIDITFQGNAAAVIVYGPNRQLQFTQGADGVICGQQTRRIPYCGDIESFTFLQTNYTIKSIEVVSKFDPYSVEETDLSQLTLQSIVGWTYSDGTYSISLAASSGKTVGFAGTLLDGFVGRMGIKVIPSSAPNVAPTDILYSDGVNATSIPMLNDNTILWIPDIIGSIVFTNNLNSAITIQLTPTVVSFLGVSTAYGAAIPQSVALLPFNTCSPVTGFLWSEFIDHLSVDNIQATMSDLSLDNTQLVIKLGGPLTCWGDPPGSTFKIFGGYGQTDAVTLSIPFGLKMTNGGPDYDNLSFPRPNIYSIAPYKDLLDNHLISGDPAYADFNNPQQTFIAKKISTDGHSQQYWEAKSTIDSVWLEIGYQTNPGATNLTKGYCGYYWIYFNGTGGLSGLNGDPCNIEEFRQGIIDSEANINDPAFDGSTMRFGIWVKKNGSNYDIKQYLNGALLFQHSIAFTTGLKFAGMSFATAMSTLMVTDGKIAIDDSLQVNSDTVSYAGPASPAFHAVNIGCSKYGQYIKPNAGNTNPFYLDEQFNMITDPSYTL